MAANFIQPTAVSHRLTPESQRNPEPCCQPRCQHGQNPLRRTARKGCCHSPQRVQRRPTTRLQTVFENVCFCSGVCDVKVAFPLHYLLVFPVSVHMPPPFIRTCLCFFGFLSTSLRMSPGSENYALSSSLMLGRSPHNRSSPSNLSCSSDTGSGSSAHWRQKSMPEG